MFFQNANFSIHKFLVIFSASSPSNQQNNWTAGPFAIIELELRNIFCKAPADTGADVSPLDLTLHEKLEKSFISDTLNKEITL